ncbi:hypothetical protein BROC_00106 [Candidatus Brocadiaceae bacterium]|nr:hypothetical protein BROC_00106 [Candidatus Brocadiaceae bacterium]
MYFHNKKVIPWLAISSFIYMLGCAPLQIKEGIFSPPYKNYTITIPETEKGWEPIRVDKEDIALWHKQHKAMIAAISSDIENKKLSLEMLNRHLFLGMTNKKIISKESVLVDNESALHIIVEGEMDNCKLKINSYVIKVGDKVYDLVSWASSDSFDYVQGDFENMVRSFQYTKD